MCRADRVFATTTARRKELFFFSFSTFFFNWGKELVTCCIAVVFFLFPNQVERQLTYALNRLYYYIYTLKRAWKCALCKRKRAGCVLSNGFFFPCQCCLFFLQVRLFFSPTLCHQAHVRSPRSCPWRASLFFLYLFLSALQVINTSRKKAKYAACIDAIQKSIAKGRKLYFLFICEFAESEFISWKRTP